MINIFMKGTEFGKVYYADLTEQDLEAINAFILSMGIKPVYDRIYSQVPYLSQSTLKALSKGMNVYPVTFKAITLHTREEISSIKGIGKKALQNIDKELQKADLSYKQSL